MPPSPEWPTSWSQTEVGHGRQAWSWYFPLMLIDMSWRGLRRRLLRRGATGEGHLEADLCWSVACMGRGGVSSKGRFWIATRVTDVSGGGVECLAGETAFWTSWLSWLGVYPSGCGRVDGILVSFSISIGDVGVVGTTSLGSLMKGEQCLRYLLLRRVHCPEPSMRMRYWSWGRTSVTSPVLSHLVGWFPVWFCTRTWSPILRSWSGLVCWLYVSIERKCRCASACSRSSASWIHSCLILRASAKEGKWSRSCRPYSSWAGDTPRSWRGVLRYWSSARAVESVLRSPLGEMFSRRRRFAVLTASSARPLLCGL